MKDTYPKYRGNTSTPTQAEHHQASLYHNLGVGGVDFPALFKVLRDRKSRVGGLRSRRAPAGRRHLEHSKQSCGQHQLSEKCAPREIACAPAALNF